MSTVRTAPKPTHWLTMTTTYVDGTAERASWASEPGTAGDAQRSLARRFRAAGTKVRRGPGWLEYDQPQRKVHGAGVGTIPASTVRCEWSDVRPSEPDYWQPSDLAAGVRPRAGVRVRVGCEDAAGVRVVGDMTVGRVDLLGCGCWRLAGLRPGARVPDSAAGLHALTGCALHPSEVLPAPDVERVPVVAAEPAAPEPAKVAGLVAVEAEPEVSGVPEWEPASVPVNPWADLLAARS